MNGTLVRATLVMAIVLPHVTQAQTDATAALPGAGMERDTASLLSAKRRQALGANERAAWDAYVDRSRAAQAIDRALLVGELATRRPTAPGSATMTRAPFASASFGYTPASGAAVNNDSTRRVLEAMLTFQTPSGGWSKHIDFTKGPRQPGQSFFSENESWQYIATIDNGSTTSELRFLMDRAHGEPRARVAVDRGVRYLLAAQFPNGCWPQVWPLQGGYHDNATFNDDAIVEVMRLLDDVGHGAASYVSAATRSESAAAVQRALECVLRAQVMVDGQLTVWGQQHDPLTLAPTSARSYELTSLTSKESAGVVDFLMSHAALDARIPPAVDAAVGWFERVRIAGMRNEGKNGLVPDATAGPQWARMYEIGTNKPIFSNRDGIKRYDFQQLTDRREGYGWYSDQPARTLARYKKWAPRRPATPQLPAAR